MYMLLLATLVSTANGTYYGKLISSQWGDNPAHDLQGDVYAVDESSFRVIGFSYDGVAPGRKELLKTVLKIRLFLWFKLVYTQSPLCTCKHTSGKAYGDEYDLWRRT